MPARSRSLPQSRLPSALAVLQQTRSRAQAQAMADNRTEIPGELHDLFFSSFFGYAHSTSNPFSGLFPCLRPAATHLHSSSSAARRAECVSTYGALRTNHFRPSELLTHLVMRHSKIVFNRSGALAPFCRLLAWAARTARECGGK